MPTEKSYFNTTDETAEALKEFEASASAQDKSILALFTRFFPHKLSPAGAHELALELGLIDAKVPLTSIRRSITNLANKGLLEKTGDKVMGIYGRPENCWQLAKPVTTAYESGAAQQLRLFR